MKLLPRGNPAGIGNLGRFWRTHGSLRPACDGRSRPHRSENMPVPGCAARAAAKHAIEVGRLPLTALRRCGCRDVVAPAAVAARRASAGHRIADRHRNQTGFRGTRQPSALPLVCPVRTFGPNHARIGSTSDAIGETLPANLRDFPPSATTSPTRAPQPATACGNSHRPWRHFCFNPASARVSTGGNRSRAKAFAASTSMRNASPGLALKSVVCSGDTSVAGRPLV